MRTMKVISQLVFDDANGVSNIFQVNEWIEEQEIEFIHIVGATPTRKIRMKATNLLPHPKPDFSQGTVFQFPD